MTDNSDQQPRKIGLADAIASLRAELSKARSEGTGADIRFDVGEITVELDLEFGWEAEAGGGFKLFSFVDVSAKGTTTNKSSQKVTLKLTVDPNGETSKFPISAPPGQHMTDIPETPPGT